ncbi:MAG TPA: hypothetical protein VFC67_26330 [Prolixibacteraceae bacterium]|nr:hypothetical protein [Prolixibacteraceae bacterium]
MKRVLSLRNRVVAGTVLTALLFSASSFTFSPFVDAPLADNPPQKKEQRIKIIVIKDGKETKIDTTFNFPDEKMVNAKVDSMLKKFDVEGIKSEKFDVLINHPGKRMKFISRGENLPGDEQFDVMIQQGDSGLTKHVRKIIHVSADGDVISMGDPENSEFLAPPPPPPPPPPFMMNEQFGGDPFSFDTNDASIISYDKKDIGKGLEKITIIRKKKAERNEKREVQVRVETSDDSKN